jgi:hypothetical protein
MNAAFLKRLEAAELAVARLTNGAPADRLEVLAFRDPRTLTDAECVEAWRHLAKQQAAHPAQAPVAPQERAAILDAWRRLAKRPGPA